MTAPAQTVKSEVKASESKIERWITTAARSHKITGRDSKGNLLVVAFKDYGLDLDLSNPVDAQFSEVLTASDRNGTIIFKVGGAYPDSEVGSKTEFLRTIRSLLNGEDDVTKQAGLDKLRALFTESELKKAGLSRVTEDVDALIMLALQTKSLKDIRK